MAKAIYQDGPSMRYIAKPRADRRPAGQIHLRAMQDRDLRAVYKLEKLCQTQAWPRWFFSKQLRTSSCWVLEHQGMIIGFGIVAMVKHWAHIMNMCVAPGYRGRGLGRRIMHQLLRVARQRHGRYVWLEVRPTNYPAISLYQKMGFHQIQIRKNYYGMPPETENAIVMLRQLPTIPRAQA